VWRQDILDDRAGEIGVGDDHERSETTGLGAQAEVVWVPTARGPVGWVASAVVRGRREALTGTNLLTGADDGLRARIAGTIAASVEASLFAERLRVTPLVQAELLDDSAAGTLPFAGVRGAGGSDATAWPVNPRLGVVARPFDFLTAKANIGSYVRPPTFLELFGDRGDTVGNSELRAERGWAWDIGGRVDLAAGPVCGALDVTYARNRASDLIVYVPNSQRTRIATNIGEAYVRTTEAGLELDVGPWLRSRTAFTWTLTRNLSPEDAYADNELPRVPWGALEQATTVAWNDTAALTHTFSWSAATYLDAANVYALPARALHGVAFHVEPAPGLPRITAEILNLGDVRGLAVDRAPLSDDDDTLVVKPLTDFDGYPLPGRTIMVGLTWIETPRSPK
jgi:outer membrane receptor protein involved in Fe transport